MIRKNYKGRVVKLYDNPGKPYRYQIEFYDDNHHALAAVLVNSEYIKKINE